MTLNEIIANIRTELSDSATFWSADELTRAVRKTVSMMSRLVPNRDILETTVGDDVTDESVTTPATADPDSIVDGVTLNGESDGATLTITSQIPDVPRRLTVTLTDANHSVTELTIIVKGYDEDNKYIEETWNMSQLQGQAAIQGNLYFKRITQVEVDDIGGSASAADLIDVGTGNAYDSYVYLANKPIKYDSETVTSSPAGTTYVRDTDYTIDYIKGGIKFINGGSMAAGTAYLVDYSRDTRVIDMTALVPKEDYLKVERVEYPVGSEPPAFVVPEIHGDFIYLKGAGTSLSENDHVRIIYTKPWKAPGTNSEGDYPEHLDDVVIIGACGQALLIKAEKYVQQAITEIALTNAAADSMATPLADINSALDKVATYLETNGTTDNAKDVLANITDDIANLRTAIESAVDLSSTYLTNATTPPSAHDYLIDGDDKIITINDAERVAENYLGYAQGAIAVYNALLAEASIRLSNLRSYIEEASGWVEIGNTFVAEAAQRINEVMAWAQQADRYVATSNQYLIIAGRYLASGQSKINEFLIALGVRAEGSWYHGSSEQL